MNFNYGLIFTLCQAEDSTQYAVLFLVFHILAMAAGYFLGSINSAILVSRALHGEDIRKLGSGNAGLTNVYRVYGKKEALLTLAGDVLKTALAIGIGGFLLGFAYVGGISFGTGCYVAGTFAVVGHIFPIYHQLKGGKGVLATATMALILSPAVFLILFLSFALILWLTKYVSLSSVTAAMLYPVVVYAYLHIVFPGARPQGIVTLTTMLLAVLIVCKHIGNLQRIYERTENQFSFHRSKKSKKEDADDER